MKNTNTTTAEVNLASGWWKEVHKREIRSRAFFQPDFEHNMWTANSIFNRLEPTRGEKNIACMTCYLIRISRYIGMILFLVTFDCQAPCDAISHLVSYATAINRFSPFASFVNSWIGKEHRPFLTIKSCVCWMHFRYFHSTIAGYYPAKNFRTDSKHFMRALLNSLDIYAYFNASTNSHLIYCSCEKP